MHKMATIFGFPSTLLFLLEQLSLPRCSPSWLAPLAAFLRSPALAILYQLLMDRILARGGHSSWQLDSQLFEFNFWPRFLEAERRRTPINTRILVQALTELLLEFCYSLGGLMNDISSSAY
jgi:hypothetical protein